MRQSAQEKEETAWGTAGGQSEEVEQKRPDMSGTTKPSNRYIWKVTRYISHSKGRQALSLPAFGTDFPTIPSFTPIFPHRYNFLAHKYHYRYLYNAELMPLISSCKYSKHSKAQIISF